ncbi:MAG: lysylphosphatidylglycerol synthase transmembrane domain-containing protein [Flavobacteriaceae bacterium]|nr:lysylphosphatidylglycerol synthase transmembrane domain-containing protein [Flavobacteriaceae bacterium]
MDKKKNPFTTFITIAISIVFAVFFMWLALGDLDFSKIKHSLSEANYFWVFASIISAIFAYAFRAIRWNLLLEPMGYQIKNSNAFWTISFGYMMNLTIPRSGELARATALYGVEKIPVEKSFATIVIERVVDLCFMFLFLAFTFVLNTQVLKLFFDRLTNYKGEEQQKNSATDDFLINLGIENITQFYFYLKIISLGLIVLVFSFLFLKFRDKFISFAKGILEGLLSIFKMKKQFKFFLYSSGIWLCYFLSAYFICLALEETAVFSLGDIFLVITAGSLGMMVPTSGGAGSFHIAIKLAIAGIFVSWGKDQHLGEEIGLTYAILSHSTHMLYMLVMGLISLPILMKRKL